LSVPEDNYRPPVLYLRNLFKKRGAGYRLRIPELAVAPASKILLLGDSGSGKSTTLDLLALVLKPDGADDFSWRSGGRACDLKALWRNRQADRLGRLRRGGLGYVLQTGGLLPFLTVRENILLTAEISGMDRQSARRRLDELFDDLKIGHLGSKLPSQISVGERQRCAIARAVIHKPALILADEPTASLDPPTAGLVFKLLLDLSRQASLVVASHDVNAPRHDFDVHRVKCRELPEEGGLIEAVLAPEKC
jgi:putative ABC transport system ATP-binding protein